MLPLLRDKAARYVCHSPYARDPYDQLCTVSVASCAHTPSSWYRCSSTTMQPCTSCLSPCAHTPTQAVLRCLSGVMRARTEAACAAAPQQRRRPVHRVSQHLCTCTSIRALSLWRHAHIHRSSSRCCSSTTTQPSAAHQSTGAHTPDTRPALSLYRHERAQEQHVLPLLRDNAARSSLCRSSATT